MTEHDDVIDSLRRARPEDLPDDVVSPHAPAAQALLKEILSMQTIQSPDTTVEDVPVGRRHRPRRLLVVGAVAAATAAVVVAASIVLNPVEPTAASTIEAALTKSSEALRGSGRADITMEDHYVRKADGTEAYVESYHSAWEFSGDDSQVTLFPTSRNGVTTESEDAHPINRFVDGELYLYIPGCTRDDRDTYRWCHDIGPNDKDTGRLDIGPETVLDQLQPAGGFEEVGTETIDGVATRRLRAKNPQATPEMRQGMDKLGEVTKLEVWVGEDGFVRRIDLAFVDDEAEPVTDSTEELPLDEFTRSTSTVSIHFFDFGEPITIEVPPDAVDIDVIG